MVNTGTVDFAFIRILLWGWGEIGEILISLGTQKVVYYVVRLLENRDQLLLLSFRCMPAVAKSDSDITPLTVQQ